MIIPSIHYIPGIQFPANIHPLRANAFQNALLLGSQQEAKLIFTGTSNVVLLHFENVWVNPCTMESIRKL